MTVMLTPEMEQFVAEKVRAGVYRTADEAVNALLAMTREQERLTPEDVAELRLELDPAIAQADGRHFVEFSAEDVISEGRATLDKKRKGA